MTTWFYSEFTNTIMSLFLNQVLYFRWPKIKSNHHLSQGMSGNGRSHILLLSVYIATGISESDLKYIKIKITCALCAIPHLYPTEVRASVRRDMCSGCSAAFYNGPTEITSTWINSLLNYSIVTLRNSMQPPNGTANLLESYICCIIKVNKGVTV